MVPKFKKVELILLEDKINKTDVFRSKEKIEFLDCGLVITGNHIIITTNGTQNVTENFTIGRIFHLDNIDAYKTISY